MCDSIAFSSRQKFCHYFGCGLLRISITHFAPLVVACHFDSRFQITRWDIHMEEILDLDLDELQGLESNSHLPDEEEEDYAALEEVGGDYYEDQPSNFQPPSPQPQSQIPSPSVDPSTTTTNNKKRPRLDLDTDDDERVSAMRPFIDAQTVYQIAEEDLPRISHDDDNIKYLSQYASEIDGDCVPVTAPSGERVYAKIHEQILTADGHDALVSVPSNSSGLISEPVSVLLQKADQNALMKALEVSAEVRDSSLLPETSVVTEELWVNKYAPKYFTELLSDEQTNREVLFWLKQWDSVVFGTAIRNTGDEVLSALRRHSSVPHNQKNSNTSFLWKNRVPRWTEEHKGHSAKLDQENIRPNAIQRLQNRKLSGSGTPDQKVLLLCGPPGLGKTTLAHVAAKHCGYHVVEINASDDRSSTTIEAKILDAVQMNSVMADSKPKCLVIDEIDGALGDGKGAVEVILKMVDAQRKSDAGKETSTTEDQSARKSSKGHKSFSLSRPVICICNDLYAPSLRPLRLKARVHVFAQPTVNRVVSRLKYICNKEGFRTSSIALTALAEHTECDIRSCLNTLQFLHKKKESLNLVALSSQVIGRKDMTRGVFDIWKEVFQKKKMKQSPKCAASQIKTYDVHDLLYSLVSNRGDYELVIDGIHENFLQMHYHDPLLQKTVHCLNALGISDLLHQYVMRTHHMSVYGYYPFVAITIHRLLARVERRPIEWPKSFHRYRTLFLEKMETIRSWQSKIAPCVSRHLSVNSFVEDTISPLLHILCPANLRPVALHLLSQEERNDLDQLVSTMVSCSLTYKNMKSDPFTSNAKHDALMDASSLSLDPPIQDFVSFKDYKWGGYELKLAVKQVLLHEVEKQKIVQGSRGKFVDSTDSFRRENNGVPESSKVHEVANVDFSIERTKKPIVHKSSSSLGSGRSSADEMKLKYIGDVKKRSVGSFNFFDRFKKLTYNGKNVSSPAEKTATVQRDDRPLLFKFNEGFTNAVKRPVRIREFLS